MTVPLLVVDDEQEIRDALSRHFRFLGYDVETAANGRAALDLLAQKPFYVIISDIVMPEMNGVELLRTVRKEFPMVRVVVITGYVTQENVLACMRHDAETCIFKPLGDLKELEEAVAGAAHKTLTWKQKLHQLLERKPQPGSAPDLV